MKRQLVITCIACALNASGWAQTLHVAYRPGSKLLLAIPALYNEVGLVPEFVILPNARALKNVENGTADADIGRVVGATVGYQNMVECTESLYDLHLVAAVKKGSSIKTISVEDLKHYRLAYIRGYKQAEFFLTQHGLEGHSVTDGNQMALMLAHDRFDIGLIDSSGIMGVTGEAAAGIVVLPNKLATSKLVHVLGKKWTSYCPKLDSALKKMKADGRWSKLVSGTTLETGKNVP